MAGDKYDKYTAAAERGFEARKAGLQAKKDEQPANTARSYLAKQREWIVSALRPPPFPFSSLSIVRLMWATEVVRDAACRTGRDPLYLAGRRARDAR